uniref:kunitz trypsin inhibitor 5-like n=1 Tax=Erigeron canadensis TaxID=72917 RepID=UPI001CB9041A|nr:kunitz trypsin inhibitor 5-like [Erigeron canadensis]
MNKSLFIFIFLSILSLSSGQYSPTPVRDTDKNVLRVGTNYYIVPAVPGGGGGLITARGPGQLCPLEVAQQIGDKLNGSPLSFSPANPNKDGIIFESTDINIKFMDKSCAPSTVWRVDDPNYFGERYISTQGMLGRPGRETINNWFKIQKYEDHYKLVHCPSVCKTCKIVCEDIGIKISERGRRSLVLNKKPPFKVMFKKA